MISSCPSLDVYYQYWPIDPLIKPHVMGELQQEDAIKIALFEYAGQQNGSHGECNLPLNQYRSYGWFYTLKLNIMVFYWNINLLLELTLIGKTCKIGHRSVPRNPSQIWFRQWLDAVKQQTIVRPMVTQNCVTIWHHQATINLISTLKPWPKLAFNIRLHHLEPKC